MGRPIWREPTEKRTPDAPLEPRREAITRRSAGNRPRVRGSERSSDTLFNLLRSDYALEGLNTGPATWSDAPPGSLFSSARAAAAVARRGLGRSGPHRSVTTGEEVYTPWFPPAGDRELAMQRRERELERIREENERRTMLDRLDREREITQHNERMTRMTRLTEDHLPDDMSWFRFPRSARYRYASSIMDEDRDRDRDRGQEPASSASREIHLPRFNIDGLGDRERSLSPDVTQWELMAELGFPGCDQEDSEDSEDDDHNLMDALGTLEGEVERDRSEVERLRRVANMFTHRRDLERMVGGLQ